MILDLPRFVASEQPYWQELEVFLTRQETQSRLRLSLEEVRRLHYLYERAAADLARLRTFSAEPETRRYLEQLVARAYAEMHETRQRPHRLAPRRWFFRTLPATFRRHLRAFGLALAVTLAGALFGGLAHALDPEAKRAMLPAQFAEHLGDPAERVAREEQGGVRASAGQLTSFSARLMVNNVSVAVRALAFGMSFGVGTLLVLFYNGVILGLVSVDYAAAGHLKFLLGWLLPHGAVEIPAVLMAGQAGLVLAGALLGRGQSVPVTARLRAIAPDLVTLIGGVALLLVWAGLVEAFLSQYHEPVLPYAVKIGWGLAELGLLGWWLGWSGRAAVATPAGRADHSVLSLPGPRGGRRGSRGITARSLTPVLSPANGGEEGPQSRDKADSPGSARFLGSRVLGLERAGRAGAAPPREGATSPAKAPPP